MALEDITARWTAFGWDVKTINGDDVAAIDDALKNIDFTNGKPHLFISETTKGKGVSFMENVAKWHHGVPNEEQYNIAISEIECRINEL